MFNKCNVMQLIEQQVILSNEKIALVYRGKKLSYKKLNSQANQLAHKLKEQGIHHNQLVAIALPKSPELIIAMLAVLKAGAAYLPLDYQSPRERLQTIIHDSKSILLITDTNALPVFTNFPHHLINIDDKQLFQGSEYNLNCPINSHHLAYVIYTSGSSGIPKGVMIEHHSLSNYLNYAFNTYQTHTSKKGGIFHSSVAFDLTITSIYLPLLQGGTLYIMDEKANVEDLAQEINTNRDIKLLKVTPSHLKALNAYIDFTQLNDMTLIVGGEALLKEDIAPWLVIKNVNIFNEYGPTEATVGCTTFRIQENGPSLEIMPIGYPIYNTKIYLLDKNKKAVPDGEVGEIYIAGSGLARGYLHQNDLTKKQFIPNPFVTQEEKALSQNLTIYRSGDLGKYTADKNLIYLGREDSQIKIQGFRVDLQEIEGILSRHGDVAQCHLRIFTHAGNKKLLAYIVPGEFSPSEIELREFLQTLLPVYMIPSFFIYIEKIPLTLNGKVDSDALPLPDLYLPYDNLSVQEENCFPLEQDLKSIWMDVLKVTALSIDDNFYRVGGDSIISLQLVAKARRKGLYFTVQDLLNNPTISSLALRVKNHIPPPLPVINYQNKVGIIPLSPIQRWFFQHDFPNKNHFNQSILLKATSIIDMVLLNKAFLIMFTHHEALRFRFYLDEHEEWQQEAKIEVEMFEIEIIRINDNISDTIKLYSQRMQKGLDLAKGKLIKVICFECGKTGLQQILVIIHHLVIDTVSWRVLIEDLETVYQNLVTGKNDITLLPSSTYFHWVNSLLTYAASNKLVAEAHYWQKIENNIVPLPEDFNLGPLSNKCVNTITQSLTQNETLLLLQNVNKAYKTQINDILLTALVLATGDLTGHYSLSFCLEGHGREEHIGENIDLSRTAGWFTSLFPVILSLDQPDDLGQAIKRIKEILLFIPNKGIGYGLINYTAKKTFFHDATRPNLIFNYLGQWNNAIKEGSVFELVEPISIGCVADDNAPFFPIEINTEIKHDVLNVMWTYSKNHFKYQTIEKFAFALQTRLSEIIVHCCQQANFGYTPSDFKLTNLSQQEIDEHFSIIPDLEDVYPLSPMQFGILFHHLYSPTSRNYFVQTIFRINGYIDNSILQQACQRICDKHAILRTGIIYQGLNEPVQYVIKSLTINFEFEDWVHFSIAEQENKWNNFLAQEQKKGFHLQTPPLFRVMLIRKGEQEYYFCWAQHHILLDGWSSSLILNDLFTLYRAILQKKSNLAVLSRPLFRNYVEWQRIQQKEGEAREFWQNYLASLEDVTHLSFKSSCQEDTAKEYDTYSLVLSTEQADSIISFAHNNNLTLNTVILAGLVLTLKNYIPYQELVIGVTVSGRNPELAGVEDIAGLLINTLPLRFNEPPLTKISDFLKNLQNIVHDINHYSYLPLAEIQALAKTDRHLFNAIFVFEKYPIDEVLLEDTSLGFTIEEFIGIEHTEYPLTITALQGRNIEMMINYQTKLFDQAIVDRMLHNFLHITEQIIQNQEMTIQHIDPLSPEEKRKILHWGEAKNVKSDYGTLKELFELQVEKTPHYPAIICDGKVLDYYSLNNQANQLAHYLCQRGVGRETLVTIFCNRSFEMIIGIMAVLKAGGAYVPVDTNYPLETLLYILKDSQSPILLTQVHCAQRLPVLDTTIICIDALEIAACPTNNFERVEDQKDLAYMIYTSGSTGKPKGVMVEQASICARLAAYQANYTLTSQDTVLCQTSISFDVSLAELFWPFSVGAKVVLSTQSSHAHLMELENLIYQYNVTFAQFVPSVLKIFLMHIDTNKTYALKCICSGGESLDYKLVEEFYKKLPNTKLENAYGPTEATIDATIYHCSQTDDRYSAFVPIGRPLGNGSGYVLNQWMQPVPIGVVGELYIGGKSVARGYLNNAHLTKKSFLSPPGILENQDKDGRLYKTGDLCQWLEDGNLEYVGRADNQIKIRGFRVELEEIEEVLLKNFELKDVVVVVKQDASENKYLIAYVVLKQEPLNLLYIRNKLGDLLLPHMVPNDFIILDNMPLTPNGKADRKKIANISHQINVDKITAPRNSLEQKLCILWKTLLHREEIGIDDNFFFLGGNSILATQLILMLKKDYKYEISLAHFFSEPTIENLAKILSNQQGEDIYHNVHMQIRSDIQMARSVNCQNIEGQLTQVKEPNILLTGASGFLGVHLLEKMVNSTIGKVYCLMRGENENIAKKRLISTFKQYNLMHLINHPRIIPIMGDITQSYLGIIPSIYQVMLKNIDEIYHNGALVHHVYDYSRLQKENVYSTIEILRLASLGCPKKIHFISTLSTGLDKDSSGRTIESFVQKVPIGNEGGYTLSKWTSEKILADAVERGFNCTIHRLPQIMGNTLTGISPTEKTHINLLMKNWIELGMAPKGMGNFDFLPVDFTAACIVKICRDSESTNQVFNYGHPNPISFDQLITGLNQFGYKIQLVDWQEWENKVTSHIQEDSALYSIWSLYADKNIEEAEDTKSKFKEDKVVTKKIHQFIKKHQLKLPLLNKQLLFCYFNHLKHWLNN